MKCKMAKLRKMASWFLREQQIYLASPSWRQQYQGAEVELLEELAENLRKRTRQTPSHWVTEEAEREDIHM